MPKMFAPLPPVPDHPALERDVLDLWEREGTFFKLVERNRGGPRFSFMDGPITANNPMGVHHAWGRTLKDVFQRYKALRGFDERYQNGFDCQGLHVEVEVEKSLGLDSKRDIEEYGLAEFAQRCKERVAHFAGVIIEQSKRLGMWMDWDNSHYTFSDTNIEYIWRFLKEVHARDWLYKGHRSTQWCPRCGTSLSKHEQAGEENYIELKHPSLFVRFPLKGRDNESLVVWTTTPWTLPANVAAAVKPDAEYGLTREGLWYRVEEKLDPDAYVKKARGEELVGLEYEGPFDSLPAQQGVVHRVIPWDEVSLDEGTGIVHIAPGAGAEDFELSRVHDLPVLMPIDESGRMLPGYGELEGRTTNAVEEPVIESLHERGLLVDVGTIEHRYPICWRCKTPLVFRVVDDWFISAEEIRQPMLDANATVEWTPSFYSKRMDDWLRNMGDWNISRKRYFGLPLPFYPCSCGHLNVIGSRAELEERATAGLEDLQELHRPWIDAVTIRCEHCGGDVERIPEVGDAWLDAGIVHFSTLGWQNPVWVEHGNGTGAAAGLTGGDLPDHSYWEKWFPADWVSESREQIRLWFYSQSFMAVTLDGRSPYRAALAYERVLDETGREMHKSTGNAIDADEAIERMGADVMRWIYCAQVPSQNINFGYGTADEVKRRLLTFWNSVAFFITYANVDGFYPEEPAGELQPLDRWLVVRTAQLVREATDAYERYWTPGVTEAFERFVDDLSNWYIRRSRRRFWEGDKTALRVLWEALTSALQVVSPLMPFLAEHLWRHLVSADESVFLAPWPEAVDADHELLAEVAEVRRIVELGRQARGSLKLRQPLRRMYVRGAGGAKAYADEIAEELRVHHVDFDKGPVTRIRLLPDLAKLGPRLGAKLRDVQAAIERGEIDQLADGRYRVAGELLASDEVLRGERIGIGGWTMVEDDHLSIALDTALDDDLRREGRVLDLIHRVNAMRREAGLELTDRIRLWIPDEDLMAYSDQIKEDTLAVSVELGDLRLERHSDDSNGFEDQALDEHLPQEASQASAWSRQHEVIRRSLAAFASSPEFVKQQRNLQASLVAFTSDPAWLEQQRALRESLTSFASNPVWLKQQRALQKSLTALASEPGLLKQQRALQKTLEATISSPAWRKQHEALQKSLETTISQQNAVQMSLRAAVSNPTWRKQQSALQASLRAFVSDPEWRSQFRTFSETFQATPDAFSGLETITVAQRAFELAEQGLTLPSEAIDVPALTTPFEHDEVGFLAAVPFIYETAPPSIRRKIRLALAALAVATSYYIVAIARGQLGMAVEMYLGALLALWQALILCLDAVDELEAKSLHDDDRAS